MIKSSSCIISPYVFPYFFPYICQIFPYICHIFHMFLTFFSLKILQTSPSLSVAPLRRCVSVAAPWPSAPPWGAPVVPSVPRGEPCSRHGLGHLGHGKGREKHLETYQLIIFIMSQSSKIIF